MTISDILREKPKDKQYQELVQLFEVLQSQEKLDQYCISEDFLFVVQQFDELDDVQILDIIWRIVYFLPPNDTVKEYCEKQLKQNINKNSLYNNRWQLLYLLKYYYVKREQLISEYLDTTDVYMKFSAIEALASINLEKALKMMIDLYEHVEYEHTISDAIELWLVNKGSKEISEYLEEKILSINDDDLKDDYIAMKNSIIQNDR